MKRHISIFAFLLCAFAVVGLSVFAAGSGSDSMRLSPIGYRLGATGDIKAYDPSVVTVAPSDTSIVTSNKAATLTATLNRDYKVVRWQKFDGDPRQRPLDPIEEFGEKSETVSVDFNPNVAWMYVTVVVEYDPVRTVKARRSSFGKGTVTIDPETNVYLRGESVTLTAEPAEGYSFVRWSDGNADHVRTLTVDEDIDLIAYIEPDSSRVSFSAGEGAVLDVTSKRVSFGNAYGELPVPTSDGLVFTGWADPDGRAVTAKTTVDRSSDHTLYAQWEIPPESYTVVFDANGGTGTQIRVSQTFEVGVSQKLRINTFYKPGSVFVGWNQNEDAEEKQYSDEQIVQDLAAGGVSLTLFAVWRTEKVAYTVHFDKNADDATGTMTDQQFAGGEEKPLSGCTFKREGWTFLGWSTDPKAVEAAYQDREKVQDLTMEKGGEVDLYAVWTKNPVYYISYMATDSDTDPRKETVEQGKEYTLATNGYARTGYTFAGWTNGKTKATYPAGKKCTAQELAKMVDDGDTITFVADWKPITYTLKFDGNGGTCNLDPKTLTYDYPQKIEYEGGKVVPQDHYDFQFWSTDPKETNVVYRWSSTNELWVTNLTTVADDTVVWYAIWKGVSQTVVINGKMFKLENGSQLRKPDDPARKPGYAFSGDWTTNGEDAVEFPIVVTHDFNLDPLWIPIQYAVRFNPNGGEGEPYVQDMLRDVETALTSNRFARTGYGFANWTNATGMAYADGAIVTNLAEEGETNDLHAAWAANRYWVNFDGNGATDGKMAPQEFAYDVAQALTSNAFTKTGYSFAGWADGEGAVVTKYADGEVVSNLTAEANATNTLWATWTVKRYEISFDSAGGSTVNVQSNDYGTALALPTPVREGYAFNGWYEGDDPFTSSTMPARNVALTAHWSDPNTYTVRFNGNGGTNETGRSAYEQSFAYDEEKALTSNAFVRTGHAFANWTNATGTAYADGAKVKNLATSGAVDLYAKWTAIEYECLFDGQSDGKRKYGEKITPPADPAKSGYTFKGWTLNGGDVDFSTFTMPDHDVAFTSKWEAITYTIAFDGNGATSGEMTPTNVKYDVEIALPSNTFERTGYRFAGWDVTAPRGEDAAGTVIYADGAVVSNLTAEAGRTVTLYAVWNQVADPLKTALGFDVADPITVTADPADCWESAGDNTINLTKDCTITFTASATIPVTVWAKGSVDDFLQYKDPDDEGAHRYKESDVLERIGVEADGLKIEAIEQGKPLTIWKSEESVISSLKCSKK